MVFLNQKHGETYGKLWTTMENYGKLWKIWKTMENYGKIWKNMGIPIWLGVLNMFFFYAVGIFIIPNDSYLKLPTRKYGNRIQVGSDHCM